MEKFSNFQYILILNSLALIYSWPTNLGCYIDNTDFWPFDTFNNHDLLTIEICIQHCRNNKTKRFAGVQNYYQCHCGDIFPNQGRAPDRDCNRECVGNASQICGADHRINVYTVCPNGTYINPQTKGCDLTCGNCLNGEICHQVSGQCLQGCQSGYEELRCKAPTTTTTTTRSATTDIKTRSVATAPTTLSSMTTAIISTTKVTASAPAISPTLFSSETNTIITTTSASGNDASIDDNGTRFPIAGVVVGVLIILLFIIVIAVVLGRKRRNSKDISNNNVIENGHAIGKVAEYETQTHHSPLQEEPKTTNTELAPTPDPTSETRPGDKESKDYMNVVPTDGITGIPLKVHEVGDYIKKKKKEKGGFGMEFESLPPGQTSPWEVATNPMNKKKNRFAKVYAYDHSRVHLQTAPKGPFSDYINASYLDGYKSKNKFIATQGPKKATVDDLWTMIWEQDVKIVVMVTHLKEGDTVKCEKYWPDVESSKTHGLLIIKNTTEQNMPGYVIRTLHVSKEQPSDTVYNNTEEQDRIVTHFHFTDWPDKTVPLYGSVVLNFIRNVRTESKNIKTPIVVHCSAGIGRTGTYIALDYLIDQAAEEDIIDVFACVKGMRKNRTNMVQTQKQYEFIYDTMHEVLRVEETIIPTSKFAETFQKMDTVENGKQISALQAQYNMLQDIAKIQQQERTTNAAQDTVNKDKNRNETVIPNDGQRVLLMTPVSERNNYINAAYAQCYDKTSTAILTQLPLEDTVVDFWRMVYDYEVNAIVSLTHAEGERSDNEQYWPKEEKGTLESGPYTIKNSKVKSKESTVSCELSLQYKNTTNEVFIVEAKNWSDEDWKPDNTKTVFDLFSEIQQWQQKQKVNGKLVIQSLDGGMNAGMYAVLSWMIDMVNAEQAVDIFYITKQIIVVRPEFLTSLEQYRDLYVIAEEYMKNFQTYSNFQ